MSLVKEFRDFAMRGNVVDMAVGVIIGAAFGKIITSRVDNVLMPPIGYLTGGVDFKDKVLVLLPKTETSPQEGTTGIQQQRPAPVFPPRPRQNAFAAPTAGSGAAGQHWQRRPGERCSGPAELAGGAQ